MICEPCQGTGWVWRDSIPVFGVMPGDPDEPGCPMSLKKVCRECGGSGVAHCCDGLQEQPDDDQ